MPSGLTTTTNVTLPANKRVVLSGCDVGGALSVGTITIPAGSAVSLQERRCRGGKGSHDCVACLFAGVLWPIHPSTPNTN